MVRACVALASCSPDMLIRLPCRWPSSHIQLLWTPDFPSEPRTFSSSSMSQTPAFCSGIPRTLSLGYFDFFILPGYALGHGVCISYLSLESSPTWRSLQKATQIAPVGAGLPPPVHGTQCRHCLCMPTGLILLACELLQALEPSRNW